MSNKKFKIFEIKNITKIERHILLALNNSIDNPCVFINSNEKYRTTERTKEILKAKYQYSEDIIFEGIVSLCIKRLIVVRNYFFSGSIEFFTQDKHNNVEIDINTFTDLIYSILHMHRDLLNDEQIIFSDKDKDDNHTFSMEYLQIDPQVREEWRRSDEQIKTYIRSRVESFKDSDPVDIMKDIALHLFDKHKILNSNFIYLTAFNNPGISGIELADHVFREEMDVKISNFTNLENKIDPIETKIYDLGNKVDHHLLRNIEAISIFVAVITLIIGNVSFLPQISTQTPLSMASLILIINGSLLSGVSTLVQLISKIIMERTSDNATLEKKKKHSRFYIGLMIFAAMLIFAGIALLALDSFI